MSKIPFLVEHQERTLIREKRRGAKSQLIVGLILVFAGCLAIRIEVVAGIAVWSLFLGAGLVIGGIGELIWIRGWEAKLRRTIEEDRLAQIEHLSRVQVVLRP